MFLTDVLGGHAKLVGVAVAYLALAAIFLVHRRPLSKLPGPWYTKYTGAVLTLHWLKGRRAYYVHALHEKYGPIVRLSPDEVDVNDIDATKTVYNIREAFHKSSFYTNVTSTNIENVFNTPNPVYNRRLRRLLGGPMAESSLKSVEPTVADHVELVIRRIGEEMTSRGAADVLKWWTFMATDVIGVLTFGESFRMLEQGKPSQYSEELAKVAPLAAIRSTFPSLIPLTNILPIPFLNKARKASHRITEYAAASLDRYQRLLHSDPTLAQHTLFTNIYKAKEADNLTSDEVKGTAMAYMIAGTDTTANTLTYLIWSVCKHPAVKTQLLKELQALPEDFQDTHLKELKYLDHVISETLRLYSAAPSGLPRVVPQGGADLVGHWLPAGTVVCAQAYSMHRDQAIFPDPEEFRPERWSEPSKDMKDAYMPFGRGGRVCLGMHLAEMELRMATARFFLRFPDAQVSSQEGMDDQDMVPKIYFLLSPSGGKCLIDGGSK